MIALIRMNAGLILWAIGFCVLYGVHGIGCAAGWTQPGATGPSLHRLLLLTIWFGFTLAGAALWLWLRRVPPATLPARLAAPVALVGAIAMLVTGLPVVLIPDCL